MTVLSQAYLKNKIMGTTATTLVTIDGEPLVKFYSQSDGYPFGHGLELANFIKGFKFVNGIGTSHSEKMANGAGCFAAQLISHFKFGVGQTYIVPFYDEGNYNYIINFKSDLDGDKISSIQVNEFKGSLTKFLNYCKQ